MNNSPLIIICTFLPLNNENKNLWNEINQLLKGNKLDFLLLTSSDGYDYLEFPVIKIPFSLKGFDENFCFNVNDSTLNQNEIHLVERDLNWVHDSVIEIEKYIRGFKKCEIFYESLINTLKPSFVFVWGHYLSQSIIFYNKLKKKNIPVHYLERGFYSGSLMIEDLLYSETDKPNFFQTDLKESNSYQILKNLYNENYQPKYPENHNSDLEKLLLEKKESTYKIVTLLGSHDVPLFPKEDSLSTKLSPIFQSTFEAAFYFREIIDQLDKTILVIKPHPNDLTDYSILENDNVIVTKIFYNKKLFEISDVFIAGNTTLQYEAIFYEKPLILYAKSALKHSQGVYLLDDKNNIENIFKSALNQEKFDEKFRNLRLAIQKILTSHIYFYANENSFKNLNSFIDFIKSKIITKADSKTLLSRLNEFESFIFFEKFINAYKDSNKNLLLVYLPEKNKQETEFETLAQTLNEKLKQFYFIDKYCPFNKMLLDAENLISDERYQEAERILTKLLTVNKYKIEAFNDLAYIEIQKGNYNKAIEYIIRVFEINASEEVATNNLNYLLENNLVEESELKIKLQQILLPKLITTKIHSFDEFIIYRNEMKEVALNRVNFEKAFLPNEEKSFTFRGICFVCSKQSDFLVDYWNSYQTEFGKIPNWRERLVCPSCNLNNRMRLTYHLIQEVFPNFINSQVYITEQTTPLFQILKNLNPAIVGSEFLGKDIPAGISNHLGIRNEDLTNLSFHNEQFDFIISLEVLEHIPDYITALKEVYRVLKQNGKFLFTVPFDRNSKENIVRAKLNSDGSITHLLPAEYHGDPMNVTQGCLCYYHFGWELLNEIKDIGFTNAYAITTYSKEYGYLGGEQIFFVAVKGE